MYITMNRFKINSGFESGFESVWQSRNSSLDSVPGYHSFKLLREASINNDSGDSTLYSTLTLWEDEKVFVTGPNLRIFAKHMLTQVLRKGLTRVHPILNYSMSLWISPSK